MSTQHNEEKFRVEIGARFKEEREKLRLTQKQVAVECGVSERTINSWQAGSKIPAHKLEHLLTLGFNLMYIFQHEDPFMLMQESFEKQKRITKGRDRGVFHETLDRLQMALRLKSRSDLIKELEIAPDDFELMDEHNSLPYTEIIALAERQGVSLNWVLMGHGPMFDNPRRTHKGSVIGSSELRNIKRRINHLENEIQSIKRTA